MKTKTIQKLLPVSLQRDCINTGKDLQGTFTYVNGELNLKVKGMRPETGAFIMQDAVKVIVNGIAHIALQDNFSKVNFAP